MVLVVEKPGRDRANALDREAREQEGEAAQAEGGKDGVGEVDQEGEEG
jgi:hypothetical protein